jgi:heme/copper-type cytochrome/quinol oxidase subunit 3
LSAVLAHQPASRVTARRPRSYLLATIGGALTFLVVKSFEWTNEITHGYTITSNGFWSFYYTAAGIHGLHVIAGMPSS